MPKFKADTVVFECNLCHERHVVFTEYAAFAQTPFGWEQRGDKTENFYLCRECAFLN